MCILFLFPTILFFTISYFRANFSFRDFFLSLNHSGISFILLYVRILRCSFFVGTFTKFGLHFRSSVLFMSQNVLVWPRHFAILIHFKGICRWTSTKFQCYFFILWFVLTALRELHLNNSFVWFMIPNNHFFIHVLFIQFKAYVKSTISHVTKMMQCSLALVFNFEYNSLVWSVISIQQIIYPFCFVIERWHHVTCWILR